MSSTPTADAHPLHTDVDADAWVHRGGPPRVTVVDAGVVVELLVGGLHPDRLGDEELAAPHLLDSVRLAQAPGPRCPVDLV